MNLEDNDTPEATPPKPKKKLSRKEKKALKKEEARQKAESNVAAATPPPSEAPKNVEPTPPAPEPTPAEPPAPAPEEAEVELEAAPVRSIPPPKYTTWEKISPVARRKRQIANMEDGFRQVLGLVQSMRENQDILIESYKKLPEAVESVKKLADHSAQQSELLKAMHQQMGDGGSTGQFTKTLASMDQTTQLLLERAQRSEERLYSMLRRAQRRIALMTLLVLLLFVGAVAGVLLIAFPEETRAWLSGEEQFSVPSATVTGSEVTPTAVPTPDLSDTVPEVIIPAEVEETILEPLPAAEELLPEETQEAAESEGSLESALSEEDVPSATAEALPEEEAMEEEVPDIPEPEEATDTPAAEPEDPEA